MLIVASGTGKHVLEGNLSGYVIPRVDLEPGLDNLRRNKLIAHGFRRRVN
jgi:hypothetical protein